MPRGGARNRSGPPPAEDSGRSDARGIVFTALPSEGCRRKPPAWPLSFSENERVAELERQRWAEVWKSPQANAWHKEPWRCNTVALYVRRFVVAELDGKAADVNVLRQLADQIGLTQAGLKENGWKIAEDQVAQRRTAKKATARPSARSRMTVVRGDGGA